MSLVKRRVTSHAYTIQEREKQAQLHQLNLDHLSKMISEDGLMPSFIFCIDEVFMIGGTVFDFHILESITEFVNIKNRSFLIVYTNKRLIIFQNGKRTVFC